MDLELHRLLPFIPPHLARKIIADPFWEEQPDCDPVPGAVLFADISGFTPLTDLLAATGKEGPEELTRLLNVFFDILIQGLEAESGEVVKFSGDALMVLFPAGRDGLAQAARRALQAAEKLQARLRDEGPMASSAGPVKLEVKIGIGVGEVLAMEVGGLLGRWEYVIAGEPVRQAAAAESRARPGEVVASPEARAVMHPEPLEPRKVDTVAFPRLQNFEQVERTLRRFVPGAVLGWLETEDRGWLCVLRPMTVLFIGSTEIDHGDAADREAFHELVRSVQRTLYRFEGSLNKVAVDDKGTVIMALFGAPPLAHRDDGVRGVKAALEIEATSRRLGLPVAIGITTGQVFAGPVGSEKRYEYTVMGDTVNLAARLMKAAGLGSMLCDQATWREARERIRIETLEPIQVKGKDRPIPVYRPNDEKLTSRLVSGSFRPPRRLFGRQAQVEQLKAALAELREGNGGLLLIQGGTGMGKSRLLKELEIQAKIQGLSVLRGAGRSTEREVSLRAWQSVFEGFYGIESEPDPARRFDAVRSLVSELTPSLADQVSLLSDQLGLRLPGEMPTINLEPELHQQSIFNLTDSVLTAWLATRPLIIVLDDVQWLDPRSWTLLRHLVAQHCVKGRPMLVGLACRPMERDSDGARSWSELLARERARLVEPTPLDPEQLLSMLADRLQLTRDRVPGRLAQFISARSEGNPFIVEELLRAMLDQGLVEVWRDPGSRRQRCRVATDLSTRSESLPGAVRGLLLARMDRLDPDQQLTLKVASVFGRSFPMEGLCAVMQRTDGVAAASVAAHLDAFADMELVDTEATDPELAYRFSHQVTQEVAYDSMLFSQRRKLHLAAAHWIIERYGEGFDAAAADLTTLSARATPLSPYYEDLAGHYRAAGDRERERAFAMLSGLRSDHLYRNEEAARHLGRALALLDADDARGRFHALRCRERVYARMGSRQRRKDDLLAMQQLARELDDPALKAEAAIAQSGYQFGHGRVESAAELARSAVELAQLARSHALEARARHALGVALARSGDHRRGREELEAALKLAENAGDEALEAEANITLARFAERAGEYPRCLDHCERALVFARESGNLGTEARILRRMGSARLALGEHARAAELADEAEEIQRQIGDHRQEAVTLDLLGRIAIATGDYARGKACFEKSLGIRQAGGDRTGQLRALALLGEACLRLGAFEKARLCFQQALEDARELGMAYDKAEIRGRMVVLEHAVGENEKARQYGLDAARNLSRLNHPSLLASVLTSLGHAFAELGEFDSAAAAYGNASQIRSRLKQQPGLMETAAGSALLDFKRERFEEARRKIDAVVAHIEGHGVDGFEQPYRVYQSCYEILAQAGDSRAGRIITRAFAELEAAAAAISDPVLRESFLQSVTENQAIRYYHRSLQRATPGD